MESAAGAFVGDRDSWLLQDGIEDLSSLHPVVPADCLDTTRPCNDFHVTARYKLSALLLLLLLLILLLSQWLKPSRQCVKSVCADLRMLQAG